MQLFIVFFNLSMASLRLNFSKWASHLSITTNIKIIERLKVKPIILKLT